MTEGSFKFIQILLEEERGILDQSSRKLKEQIDQALKLKSDLEFERRE